MGSFFISLLSCGKFYKEQIPAYLHISKMNLSTNYPGEGSNANNIENIWVYVDDQTIGVFQLPVTFPVLYEGVHEVKIKAGIKNNGIITTRIPYPFYETSIANINLIKDSVITISPTIHYNSNTTFTWKEDFEGAAFSIVDTSGTDTVMKVNTTDVYEGNKCGIVNLDASKVYYEGRSSSAFTLPQGGAPVYLEVNYKCNNQFGIGIYSGNYTGSQIYLFVNPSTTWQKIYVELTSLTSGAGNTNPFRIFFNMYKSDTVAAPQLLIDNVKLVH